MELIDREHLIDQVVKLAKTSESDWHGVKFSASEIKFIIERQKPIESRPKGEWIDDIGMYRCSNCNHTEAVMRNYCSKCGSDMRGEE